MSPPKSITIGMDTITVKEVTQEHLDSFGLHKPGQTGAAYSFDKNVIFLNKKTVPQRKARYIIHELVHVALNRLFLPRRLEEKIVERLDEQLSMLIRDNPKLINYLQRNL